MARVVEFHYYCDRKAAKHPPRSVEGETLLVWQRQKEELVEIDICEDCQIKLTDAEAQEIAVNFGRKPVTPEEDPELTCPFGCNHGMPFKNRSGRGRHMAAAHPQEWAEMKAGRA